MKGKVGGFWNKVFMEILGLLFLVNQCYMFFLPFCPAFLTDSCSLHSGMV